MTEYLNSKNIVDAVSGVKEMKAPKHFLPEMLSKIILCSLERTDEDREQASTLIHTLRTEGFITGENFMQVRYLAPPPSKFVCGVSISNSHNMIFVIRLC